MTISPNGLNQTIVELRNGTRVLVSYRMPVASVSLSGIAYKTEKKWSATTSRHISKWLSSTYGVFFRPQEFFDNFLKEGK